MSENGGEITVGERLRLIEKRFDKVEDRLIKIEEHLEERIQRHREKNEAAVEKLADGIMKDFATRVTKLEQEHVSAAKVKEALERYQAKQQANFKWAVGFLVTLGVGNLFINFQQGV